MANTVSESYQDIKQAPQTPKEINTKYSKSNELAALKLLANTVADRVEDLRNYANRHEHGESSEK